MYAQRKKKKFYVFNIQFVYEENLIMLFEQTAHCLLKDHTRL